MLMKKETPLEKAHELEHEDEPVKNVRAMQKKTIEEAKKLGKLLKPLKHIDGKKAETSSRKKKTL